jgi:hypothetical protein
MAEVKKDPKVIASARKHLVLGERVLWAARQRGVGKRGFVAMTAVPIFFLSLWGMCAAMGFPNSIIYFLVVVSPGLLWWAAQNFSSCFLVTDRRVIYISATWPFRSYYWNHSELDAHWIRLGQGRNVIHFKPFVRGGLNGRYTFEIYPNYVENVPDIESVREIILTQIASRPTIVDEAGRAKGPRPSMPGTRTS